MTKKDHEQTINSTIREILTSIRQSATATTEVSEEKSREATEHILKQALRKLGVEE